MSDLNEEASTSDETFRLDFTKKADGSPIMAPKDGKDVQMHIDFVGKYHEKYIKQQRALTDRRLKANVGRRKVNVTAQQLEMETAETLARCVVGGFVVVDGKEVENTFEGWYKLFTDPRFLRFRDKAEELIEESGGF